MEMRLFCVKPVLKICVAVQTVKCDLWLIVFFFSPLAPLWENYCCDCCCYGYKVQCYSFKSLKHGGRIEPRTISFIGQALGHSDFIRKLLYCCHWAITVSAGFNEFGFNESSRFNDSFLTSNIILLHKNFRFSEFPGLTNNWFGPNRFVQSGRHCVIAFWSVVTLWLPRWWRFSVSLPVHSGCVKLWKNVTMP